MIPEQGTENRRIMERLIDEFSAAILIVASDPDHIPIDPLMGALSSIIASYLAQIPVDTRFAYLQKMVRFCAVSWYEMDKKASEAKS